METFLGLEHRVVIITGAGQGIGRAIAMRFAAFGANAVIADRDGAKAARVRDEIKAAGGAAHVVEVDVGDEKAVEAMAADVVGRFGHVDVLVNNAAIFSTLPMQPLDQIPLDEWEAVLRVNVTGPYLCARAVLPSMRARKRGRIINISSNTVSSGAPLLLHYVASKSALVGMTRSMARELGADNILVNAIMPAATEHEGKPLGLTPDVVKRSVDMQCLKRGAAPDDLTGAVLFLASDAASFITGQTIAVDGGRVHR